MNPITPDATTALKGKVQLANQLGGTAALPTVTGVTETGGPTALAMGAVADGALLARSGATVVGDSTRITQAVALKIASFW